MIKQFCEVDTSEMTKWISSISFERWPQQSRLANGKIRPAMVNDPNWYGLHEVSSSVVSTVLDSLGGEPYNLMLSVVMPGDFIEPHTDVQSEDWMVRVHVPLVTNRSALFISGGVRHYLEVGQAYLVDTTVEHEIINNGIIPRIHFMFDVKGPLNSGVKD